MNSGACTIAVVDDEEPVRKALGRLIRSAGFGVETFGCPLAFLQSLPRRLPDCAVLDLHMPQVNGFEVQAAIWRSGAGIPVVFITGDDTPAHRERALGQGASAFLRKPVDGEQLLEAIRSAIRHVA